MLGTEVSVMLAEMAYLFLESCKISTRRRCMCCVPAALPSDKVHTSQGQDGNSDFLSARLDLETY